MSVVSSGGSAVRQPPKWCGSYYPASDLASLVGAAPCATLFTAHGRGEPPWFSAGRFGWQSRPFRVSPHVVLFFSIAFVFGSVLAGIRVWATGLSNIPASRPCVLVPNHSSYLDSFVLAAVLPPRFVFLAKKELDRSAFLSIFLRRLGTIFTERSSAEQGVQDAAAAVEAVRAGQGLVVYPEGTFRRAAGLRPFKIGGFLVAALGGSSAPSGHNPWHALNPPRRSEGSSSRARCHFHRCPFDR